MKKFVIANGLSETAFHNIINLGIDVIKTDVNFAVNEHISFHADISFFFDGEDTLFIASEMTEYENMLKDIVTFVKVIPEKLGKEYPSDVLLNCAVTGRNLICNVDTVSPTVLKYLKDKGFSIISVKQGYTKCSVLPVSYNAIITDDPSIAKACVNAGIDVLSVSKGSVTLQGFDYGFIGGASGKISRDTIAFCGNIDTHTDAAKIKEFLNKYSMKYLSLDDNKLYDIGSIIPLYGG